jgi:hypothetical protein
MTVPEPPQPGWATYGGSGVPVVPGRPHDSVPAGSPQADAWQFHQPPQAPTPYVPQGKMPRRNQPVLILVLVAVFLLLMGGAAFGALYVNNVGPLNDSGLAMCESMRDSRKAGLPADEGNALTREERYRELRSRFAGSRYADIRDAGTKFVDLAWQLSGTKDTEALGVGLLLGGQILQSYSAFAGACTAHGVTIPPLTDR